MKMKLILMILLCWFSVSSAWADDCSFLVGTWQSFLPKGMRADGNEYACEQYETYEIDSSGSARYAFRAGNCRYPSESNDSPKLSCTHLGSNNYKLSFSFPKGIVATLNIQVSEDGRKWTGRWTNTGGASGESNYTRMTPVPVASNSTSGNTARKNIGGRADADNGATSSGNSDGWDDANSDASTCLNIRQVQPGEHISWEITNTCALKLSYVFCVETATKNNFFECGKNNNGGSLINAGESRTIGFVDIPKGRSVTSKIWVGACRWEPKPYNATGINIGGTFKCSRF